jgi:hypothetical protein
MGQNLKKSVRIFLNAFLEASHLQTVIWRGHSKKEVNSVQMAGFQGNVRGVPRNHQSYPKQIPDATETADPPELPPVILGLLRSSLQKFSTGLKIESTVPDLKFGPVKYNQGSIKFQADTHPIPN